MASGVGAPLDLVVRASDDCAIVDRDGPYGDFALLLGAAGLGERLAHEMFGFDRHVGVVSRSGPAIERRSEAAKRLCPGTFGRGKLTLVRPRQVQYTPLISATTTLMRPTLLALLLLLQSRPAAAVMPPWLPGLADDSPLFEVEVSVLERSPEPRFEMHMASLPMAVGAVQILAMGTFVRGGCHGAVVKELSTGRVDLIERFSPDAALHPLDAALFARAKEVHTVDYDQDGLADLFIVEGSELGQWQVVVADGAGNLRPVTAAKTAAPPQYRASLVWSPTQRSVIVFGGSHETPIVTIAKLDQPAGRVLSTVRGMSPDFEMDGFIESRDGESEWVKNDLVSFRSWLSLPQARWSPLIAGDIDGDRMSDFLTYGDSFLGWWAISGTDRGAAGLPAPGIELEPGDTGGALLGDVDCDGRDDLVPAVASAATFPVALSRASKPLEDVVVSYPGGRTATDASGHTSFVSLHSGAEPSFRKPGYSFAEVRRVISTANRIHIVVAAEHREASAGAPMPLQQSQVDGRKVCIGFNPGAEPVANTGLWGFAHADCPAGFAPYGLGEIGRDLACCPLPSDDVLESSAQWTSGQCPPDSIIVGFRRPPGCATCASEAHCRRINLSRYQLGSPQPGVFWGIGRQSTQELHTVPFADLPLAIRYGLSRASYAYWVRKGCVGSPWGALLVAAGEKSCGSSRFRELQYAGRPSDPPAGTPVTMFPECAAAPNPLDPFHGCPPK